MRAFLEHETNPCSAPFHTFFNICPSFVFFVRKYRSFAARGVISIGTRSMTRSPYPSIPTILRGLFVISRI